MTPITFIDLETTGFSPVAHAPLSIAALVLSGEHHGASFDSYMRPFDDAQITDQALQKNGLKYSEIFEFPEPDLVHEMFMDWLSVVAPPPTIVLPAGYYYRFDEGFLRAWFTRHAKDPAFYGNTFSDKPIDVMQELKELFPDWKTRWPRVEGGDNSGMKLTHQYQVHFKKPLIGAHTAMGDCQATMELFLYCDRLKRDPQYSAYHHLIPSLIP